MPSPLGHALAGAAAGWTLAGAVHGRGARVPWGVWRQGLLFALLGALPDLDLLLPIEHRGASHSLGAAVIAGLAVAALTRERRLGLAAGAAFATHVLLDWLGADTSPPIGIMALWPLSRDYYQSGTQLFFAISRRFGTTQFWTENLRAVAWEAVVLLPLAVLALWSGRRRGGERGRGKAGRRKANGKREKGERAKG